MEMTVKITTSNRKVYKISLLARSLSCLGCQGPSITFELFPRPRQKFCSLSGPFIFTDCSLRRGWNTTRRRLGLGPDRMEGYPQLAVRKPVPTAAGDRRGGAEGGPSAVYSGVLSGAHSNTVGGRVGRRKLDASPARLTPPPSLVLLLRSRR